MSTSEATRKSILVIEDDHDIRETFRQLLELEGYPVITAANGKEGLEKLRQLPRPALILLDLMMPVMNGWEFLSAQRADESIANIPVVVVTAVGGDGRDTLQTAGYLKKPVELQSLLDTVKEYCD